MRKRCHKSVAKRGIVKSIGDRRTFKTTVLTRHQRRGARELEDNLRCATPCNTPIQTDKIIIHGREIRDSERLLQSEASIDRDNFAKRATYE